MQIARLAVAACVLLVLVGCGIGHSSEVPESPRTTTPTVVERSDYHAYDDTRRLIGDGVVLTISPPKSFTPTDTAYPRATRATAFDLTLDNDSAVAYRPSGLSFTATIDDVPTKQVIDSTQGYTGTSGATGEIPPGESLRIAIAFAVSEQPCLLRVAVRPDIANASPVLLYDGTV